MKTSLKLSLAGAVIASVMAGSAFAAGTKAPTLRSDSLEATIGSSATVNVLDNDRTADSTITDVIGGRAKYGTVECSASGECTYTPDARATKRKTDSFTYTVVYKDAKGKDRKRSSRVNVRLKAAPVSPA